MISEPLEHRDESFRPVREDLPARTALSFRTTASFAAGGAVPAAIFFAACAILIYRRTGILALNSDDSYIYTGYVKMSFMPGAGLFSYNVGEHSAGTTGILFYYLLAAWYRVLTFLLPKSPFTLVLNSWLVCGCCFAATGAVVATCIANVCGLLQLSNKKLIATLLAASLALICGSENYLWGQMGGMENPLSGLLCIGLAAIAIHQRPNLMLASGLAAALVGTRPDWLPIALLIPPMHVCMRQSPIRERLRGTIIAYGIFFLLLAVIIIPLRLTTGQWQPSALGARVELHWIREPAKLLNLLRIAFDNGWGRALGGSWLAAMVCHHKAKSLGGIYFIPAFITLFLIVHAAAGLDNFSVHDRYISYLWPAFVLTYILAAISLVQNSLAAEGNFRVGRFALVLVALASAVVAAFGTTAAVSEISQDTIEMLQVHVWPSQWMAGHLPPGSVVAMEPAGALRTYTDFVLIDRTGLTTADYQNYARSTGSRTDDYPADFLKSNHVDYIFDYPQRSHFGLRSDEFQVLQTWTPRPRLHSIGTIALMRFEAEKK